MPNQMSRETKDYVEARSAWLVHQLPFIQERQEELERTKLIAEMKWCEAYSWVEVH